MWRRRLDRLAHCPLQLLLFAHASGQQLLARQTTAPHRRSHAFQVGSRLRTWLVVGERLPQRSLQLRVLHVLRVLHANAAIIPRIRKSSPHQVVAPCRLQRRRRRRLLPARNCSSHCGCGAALHASSSRLFSSSRLRCCMLCLCLSPILLLHLSSLLHRLLSLSLPLRLRFSLSLLLHLSHHVLLHSLLQTAALTTHLVYPPARRRGSCVWHRHATGGERRGAVASGTVDRRVA